MLEDCGVDGFDATGKKVYLVTNKGSVDLDELETLDPATGATTKLESDPENRVDIEGLEMSEIDYHVLFTEYVDDTQRLYFKDKAFEKEYHWLEAKLPGKEIHFGTRSKDENVWIVSATSDTEPGETYLWNRKQKTLDLQYHAREELPRASLSPRKPYHYKSSDGLEIHAYLTIPKGLTAKNLPLVVLPHGGPWARDTAGYDTFAQYPCQSRLRSAATELPRFHRIWQEIPQPRQRPVGPHDAGRPHLGRQSPGCRRRRR